MARVAKAAIAELEPLLSPPDVSALFQIPGETLSRWRSQREGPAYLRMGRHVRYRASDIREWLATRERLAGAGDGHG